MIRGLMPILFLDLAFTVDCNVFVLEIWGSNPDIVDHADGGALILSCQSLNLLVSKYRGESHFAGMRRQRTLQALFHLL